MEAPFTVEDRGTYLDVTFIFTDRRFAQQANEETMASVSKRKPGQQLRFHSNHGEFWYLDGLPHRLDGPAVLFLYENGNFTERWLKHGQLHREDGPAIIERLSTRDNEEWHYEGKLHRGDGCPAFTAKEIEQNGYTTFRAGPEVLTTVSYHSVDYQWAIQGRTKRKEGWPVVRDVTVRVTFNQEGLPGHWFHNKVETFHYRAEKRHLFWFPTLRCRNNGPVQIVLKGYREQWSRTQPVHITWADKEVMFANGRSEMIDQEVYAKWAETHQTGPVDLFGDPYFLDQREHLDFMASFG